MINPPAMGVFARDPTPKSNAHAVASKHHPDSLPNKFAPNPQVPATAAAAAAAATLNAAVAVVAKDERDEDDQNASDDAPDDDQGTVDEEAGVIRCICDCDDDDGFTIQCDRCLVWQHCACFGMSQASVPDEYLCEQCDPRPVDVAFAQAHQQKRKNDEARKALMDRTIKRQTHNAAAAAAAAAASGVTTAYIYSNTGGRAAHSLEASTETTGEGENLASPTSAQASSSSNGRSRKPSQALDLSNTHFVVPEVPASAGSSAKSNKRKGKNGSRRQGGSSTGNGGADTPTTPGRGTLTPTNRGDERYDDPFDMADRLEAWHVEFTPIGRNVVADPNILVPLATAMLEWEDGSPLRASPGPGGKMIVPVRPRSSLRRRSNSIGPTKTDDIVMSSIDEDGSELIKSEKASSSDGPEFGLAAVGDECVPVEMEGSSLADLGVKTYVKLISESASGGVFSNVLQINGAADEPQRSWSASRAFSRPVMHGLFAEASIPAGTFISEFRGELYSADTYRKEPINQYAALGTVKPHVHLLPPPLNLTIDARRFGNEARFARFSCHPNAVLRPILFRRTAEGSAPELHSQQGSRSHSPYPNVNAEGGSKTASGAASPAAAPSDEPELLFGIFAISDISRSHEITLGWEWDDAHIVHFLPELVQNPTMEPRELRSSGGGTRRSMIDAERHTANLVAIAERGEFPYASTEFSSKMNSVTAALMGCVLCACIGSAAAPGGGSGASANNGRKQDCAVAQMLRVGNGMSLLNVVMPGKSNRRAKLPDFSPLVGVKRWWRPLSMPPTPASSDKEAQSPMDRNPMIPNEHSDILSTTANLTEEAAIHAELAHDLGFSCDGPEPDAGVSIVEGQLNDVQDQDVEMGEDDANDDDDDDVKSEASSLTDPLSGLSHGEEASDEEDPELMKALQRVDARRTDKDDEERSGSFILPLKKRAARTRIKATLLESDSESDSAAAGDGKRGGTLRKEGRSGSKRKAKARPSRLSLGGDSDEDASHAVRPLKKRRKSGNPADPSSPLSSAPSQASRNSSLSPPPPVKLGGRGPDYTSSDSEDESASEASDASIPFRGSAAGSKKRSRFEAGEARRRRIATTDADDTPQARKKKTKARLHRESIADMGDPESSDEAEEASVDEASKVRAATPTRLSTKQDKKASKVVSSQKGSPACNKAKKARRVLSDSDTDESDREGTPKASRKPMEESTGERPRLGDSLPWIPKIKSEDGRGEGAPATNDDGSQQPSGTSPATTTDPTRKAGEADGPKTEDVPVSEEKKEPEAAAAAAAAAAAVTETRAPVVKEEPRVKLSLAEYKKRLAERRTSSLASTGAPSSTGGDGATPPPGSDGPAPPDGTPAAEVSSSVSAPPPSRTERVPDIALKAPAVAAAATRAGPDDARSSPSGTGAASAGDASPKAPVSPAPTPTRPAFFASVSAPTAIRSVEIPRSPSPESGGAPAAAAAAAPPVTATSASSQDAPSVPSPSSVHAPHPSQGQSQGASPSQSSSHSHSHGHSHGHGHGHGHGHSHSQGSSYSRSTWAPAPLSPCGRAGAGPPPAHGPSASGASGWQGSYFSPRASFNPPRAPRAFNHSASAGASAGAGGPPLRDYAGVPTGPASMRDDDPRARAWRPRARAPRGGPPPRGAGSGGGWR